MATDAPTPGQLKPQLITITDIQRDTRLQPRATMHTEWIEDYAADIKSGARMPAIDVFYDGEKYWLGDGFHRVAAAEAAGFGEIHARVREGSRRDALLHSTMANATHGHRRSNEDKRRAVDVLLADSEWALWSDCRIGEHCAVDAGTVSARRRELYPKLLEIADPPPLQVRPPAVRLATRNGTTYPIDIAKIGRNAASTRGPRIKPEDDIDHATWAELDDLIDRMETKLVADLGIVAAKRNKARADAARLDATRDMRDAIEPLWREFPTKLVGELRAIHAERRRSGAA